MTEPNADKQRKLAAQIASKSEPAARAALRLWIEQLLEIKASNSTPLEKAKRALAVSGDRKVVVPVVKTISSEFKRLAWDERSFKGRLGLGGVAVGLTLFGGQSAGIAALGTAIGVPLWVVFGAGAAFLGVLYEELSSSKGGAKTTHKLIESERKDDD